MKTTNEQEQMLEQYKTEFQNVLFNKKLYTTTDSRNSLNEFMTEAYVEGRLKSIEEIEKLKREYTLITKSFCEKNDLKLQEKEQEINKYKKAWQDYYAKVQVLNNRVDELESKLPDQEELREALECLKDVISETDLSYREYEYEEKWLNRFKTIKTFLESLGEKLK